MMDPTYIAEVTLVYSDEFYNEVDLDTAEQKFREAIEATGLRAEEVDITISDGDGKWLRTVNLTERGE